MRFVIRKSVSDLGFQFFKVWDTTDRRFVFATTRQTDAESYARRFEMAFHADLRQGAEVGAWR